MIRHLVGVRGAGKSTLVGPLAEALPGHVVLDMDELLDDELGVLGVPIAKAEGRPHWPAYNRLWVRVARLVERSSPVVLLGPILPHEWRTAGGADDAFALLDCHDDTRRERLAARGWDERELDDAVIDAAEARAAVPTVISTDVDLDATVAAVAEWVRAST